MADYSFLRNSVTDFSADAAKYNASVFTARISATTAQDYSQSTGYAATAVTQTDVQITLNKFKHVSYSVVKVDAAGKKYKISEEGEEEDGEDAEEEEEDEDLRA